MSEEELNKLNKEFYGFTVEELDKDLGKRMLEVCDLRDKNKQLQQENEELKEYCCKRNECSGRLKENHKLTEYEILNELERNNYK